MNEKVKNILETLRDVVITALIAYLVFQFVIQPSMVKGESMEPTLHDGNFSIGYRIDLKNHINYGDIVVIHVSYDANKEYIVKRVIGMPGDHIVIDYNNDTVTRNGTVLKEDYIKDEDMVNPFNAQQKVYEYDVPDGFVFVLGDNRNNSSDSRMDFIGMVSYENIASKILFSLPT